MSLYIRVKLSSLVRLTFCTVYKVKWLGSSVTSKETCSFTEVSGTCIIFHSIFQMNTSTCQSTYPSTTGSF